jgi:hypothetical protein
MDQLIATFAGLPVPPEQAIHAPDRAEIFPFIKQRRIHSGWRAILEAFFVQASQDCSLFRRTK